MNDDLKRLLDGEASDFERELLLSARLDVPSEEAMARASAALGLEGFTVAPSKWTLLAKGGAPVVALGLLALAGYRLRDGGERESGSALRPLPTVEAPLPMGTGMPPERTPQEPTVPAEAIPRSEQPPEVARKAVSRPAASASVQDELVLIDAAKKALGAGEPKVALRLVAEYRTRFPRPQFAQEAQVISIVALADSGQASKASAAAEKFLRAHPKSPHAPRLQKYVILKRP